RQARHLSLYLLDSPPHGRNDCRSVARMTSIAKAGLVVAGTLAVLATGGVVYIGSGIYNIGADDHHTKIVLAIIEQLRDRSIAVRARATDVPNLGDPTRIVAGAKHYGAFCVAGTRG